MSIDNVQDITPRVQYLASAAQTSFDYPFPIFADADLVVIVDGVTAALDTDYTVAGEGDDAGGTITWIGTAMAGDEVVTIYRDIPIERTSDFQPNGPYSSTAMNDELDRMTLIDQQLDARVNRALRIPYDAEVDDDDIELDPANYAGFYLAFDATGKPTPAALSSSTMTQATIGALLYPQTDAEDAVSVTPANYAYPADPERDVRRDAPAGDNVTDDSAEFETAHLAASGRPIVVAIPSGTDYRFTAPLDTSGPVVIRGVGTHTSGIPKTWFKFSATPGASGAQWDLDAATSYPDIENLYISHTAAAAANNGIGLNCNNVPYGRFKDLWCSNFDTGMKISGQLFYGYLNNVVCSDNRTSGLEITGSLVNGALVFRGQFSRSTVGAGLYWHDIGSHSTLIGTYREGNAGTGANITGFHTIHDQGAYSENNTDNDVSLLNSYPHWTAHYLLTGSYFDVLQGSGKSRVRMSLTSATAINNKFYNEAATAPFQTSSLIGFQPSCFIGNEYAGRWLTNSGSAEQAYSFIVDSKHPLIYWSSGVPTAGNAHAGSLWVNTDSATKNILGWRSVSSGRIGGGACTTTATTTAASKVVTLSVSNNSELVTGETISIAGTTWASGDASAMICECNSDGTITMDKTADSTVAAAAISYATATLQVLPAGMQDIYNSNVSCTSGANVQILQFALATTQKASIELSGIMASSAADDVYTRRTCVIGYSNNAGAITASAVTYANTIDGGTACTFTIVASSSGSAVRLFVTQSTGSTRLFGFSAKVVISSAIPALEI